jgi:hypothetical protein
MLDLIAALLTELRGVVRWLMLGGILLGLWLGLRRTKLDDRARAITWFAVAVPLLAWYFVVLQYAQAGGFQNRFEFRGALIPPIPLAIFLPLLIWLPVLLRSERIGAVLDVVSPAWLVGFQVYRVLGGVFLIRWAEGNLPGVFALPAGIGDVLVGALAIPVALYLQSGARGGRTAAIAWNLFGILDLLIAVSIGAMTQPGRLQMITVDVPNSVATTYPLVMIPGWAVPLSLILHGVSLRQLLRRGRRTALAHA